MCFAQKMPDGWHRDLEDTEDIFEPPREKYRRKRRKRYKMVTLHKVGVDDDIRAGTRFSTGKGPVYMAVEPGYVDDRGRCSVLCRKMRFRK